MSIFDVDVVFSYDFPTSSIDYVRNYNFNTTTATNLPLVMSNVGDAIPLTVQITTTDAWVKILDTVDSTEVSTVILPPSGSKTLIVKVDLPPEIENVSGSVVVRPNIILDIKSGSLQQVSSTSSTEPEPTFGDEEMTTPIGQSSGGNNEPTQQGFV